MHLSSRADYSSIGTLGGDGKRTLGDDEQVVLFKDKNDTAAALKQLSDILMNKLQSTTYSDASLPATFNKHIVATPSYQMVNCSSSLRVRFPSPTRVPITLEPAHELRSKKLDLNRSLKDNHQINHMCKDVELSHQANDVLSESGECLEHKHLQQGADKDLWEWALANDLGFLDQGVGSKMPNVTDTIHFMHPSQILKKLNQLRPFSLCH